ncbi:MAG: type II secretion system F family protein [Armatimonadota bacterium]
MFGAARARQQTELFRQLGAMVHAGVSLGESVSTLAQEHGNTPLGRALARVGHEVSHGHALAASLRKHERLFSPLTVAMVEVGEQSGRLDETLHGIQQYHEKDFELRHLLTRELAYPTVLFAAILLIPLAGRFILVWMTGSAGAALAGALGQLVMYAIVLGVPTTVALLVVRSMTGSEQGRVRVHGLLLSVPIIGGVARRLAVARFCRALASLYSSGVLLGTALRLAADAAGNALVGHALTREAPRIDRGGSLADALEASAVIPRTAVQMLRTGERTGDIDQMARSVADHLQQEAETAIKQAAAAIAPAAVIIAGIIVGLMVVGFYAGLYTF